MSSKFLSLLFAVTALAVVPALAATPDSGKVSHDAPILKWEGTADGYLILQANEVNYTAGAPTVCDTTTGTCDEFNLDVADSDALTIESVAGDNITEIEVQKPDGSTVQAAGDTGGNPSAQLKIGKAAVGSYIVRTWVNTPPGMGGDYVDKATLGHPSDPEVGGAHVAGAARAPQPAPAATLTVKTRAASWRARARAHALRLVLSSSGPVSDVKVGLAKGKKLLARAALARLSGDRTVRLKLKRKLAAGTYKVLVTAKDAGGQAIGATAPLKIKR